MSNNPKSVNFQPNRYVDSDGVLQTLAEGAAAQRTNAITVATAGGATHTQAEREAAKKALQNRR